MSEAGMAVILCLMLAGMESQIGESWPAVTNMYVFAHCVRGQTSPM